MRSRTRRQHRPTVHARDQPVARAGLDRDDALHMRMRFDDRFAAQRSAAVAFLSTGSGAAERAALKQAAKDVSAVRADAKQLIRETLPEVCACAGDEWPESAPDLRGVWHEPLMTFIYAGLVVTALRTSASVLASDSDFVAAQRSTIPQSSSRHAMRHVLLVLEPTSGP
jgi:hypothetical protein